jgi:hypothetical protein
MSDAVAIVTSPFTGQTQAQVWPGADQWTGTITLPPLTQCEADEWIAFLGELRGMANCFFLGFPLKRTSRGNPSGVPLVDGTNIAGGSTLNTRGWGANAFRLLLPGDGIQVGTRLHKVINPVNSDANGKATISIWPSLREQPNDGQQVIINNPQGLFRLASNKRTWNYSPSQLTRISFQIQEYR